MKQPGLTRADLVFVNRMQREYAMDELPNPEQVRFDNGRLVQLVMRLEKEIGKLLRRDVV